MTFLFMGLLIGVSVAWPPGPINAEIMRRGLNYGFRPAVLFGSGACVGDAVWAIVAGTGAALLSQLTHAEVILRPLSAALLLGLAAFYLYGAWRAAFSPDQKTKAISHVGGFFLAFTLALTSPWNLAFWIGVMGQPEIAAAGQNVAWVAMGVILGAFGWVLFLSALTAFASTKIEGRGWDVATRLITACVLAIFGARLIFA